MITEFPTTDGAAEALYRALNAVLDEYEGRVTLATAIGVLELIKLRMVDDVWRELADE
jgi:hypothetical protein